MNWISATGLRPCAAMPMAAPAISPSASGVSCTRALPKRCCSPTVARNPPPLVPTSSPSTTTDGSWAISQACAMLMASTIVIFAIETILCSNPIAKVRCCLVAWRRIATRFIALGAQRRRQLRAQIIEHGVGRLFRRRQVLLDRGVDFLAACGLERLLVGLVPQRTRLQEIAGAGDRFEPARVGDLLGTAVARGIVRRGVIP